MVLAMFRRSELMDVHDLSYERKDKIKVLVIDDDANFLFGVTRTLIKADFVVLSAAEGMQGVQKALLDRPDLILLDVNMPLLSGFQVKTVLNNSPVTENIPVIFLTALHDRENILGGLKVADDYITKPVDADILVARLIAVFRRVNKTRHTIRKEEMVQIPEERLQSWGQSVEIFDSGTSGHTRRVSTWAAVVARSLGLDKEQVNNIRKGAMLHDIGKLAIPEHILNRPGALTPSEWEIVRKHPRYGYEMLTAIESPSVVKDIPRYHHEHWDGSGYPDRLVGEAIPLAARIFSLVDVYDTLLAKRPYKPAYSPQTALEMIGELSGRHFDPFLVDHFLLNFATLQEEVENELGQNNFSYR